MGQVSPWNQLKGQVLLGREEFVESLRAYLNDVEKLEEVPRAQRLLNRLALSLLFANEDVLTKKKRDLEIRQAHLKFGYSMAEIARASGLHYSTVRRIMRGER